jgi:site-specific DNA-methyltransferase (adenine-specific)
MTDWKNRLYYGDNLDVLRRHVPDESVDLVYLDPPFNSNATYNVLFAEQDGTQAASQIKAFEDSWRWDQEAARLFEETVEAGGQVSRALQAFRALLGESNMLAYLTMMAPRLVELRRVLKPTGSLYLHCDPTASHYLKLLMDSVFGVGNFRNEITWYYYNKIHDRRKKLFPKATDSLLFYVVDTESDFTFHQLKERRETPVRQLRRKKVDGHMVNVKGEDGHVLYRISEERTLDNVWRIPCLQPAASERLGYPTQKPEALLERIIQASSNEGDLVLDPFCGCGTAIAVAERLNRRWIGIDITHLAITLMKHRLRDAFGDAPNYEVVGEPVSLPDAEALAASDPYQFQWWSLGLVGARPAEQKKGADQGIDGRLYFHDEAKGKTKQIVISVKAGKTGPQHVRDLHGVVEREKAEIGVLLTMQEPTKPMREAVASAGFYTSPGWKTKHPRLQILTVRELLDGRRIDYPSGAANVTLKKAPKSVTASGEEEGLF